MAKIIIPESVEVVEWDNWKFTERAVLCFVHNDQKLLLIHKKTGLGKGKINAPGGRIEPGEDAETAAIRETREETGIIASELECVGMLHFIFKDGYSLHGTVFFAHQFRGKMTETVEALPFWCDKNDIPFHLMWEDDQYWIPKALAGNFIHGFFIFDNDKMLSMAVRTTDGLGRKR